MQEQRHPSGVLIFRPEGPALDAGHAEALKHAFDTRIGEGKHEFCVDFHAIETMDSTGLAVLIAALRQLDGRGKIRLCSVQPAVRTLLEMTHMTRMFPVLDSVDSLES